MFDIAFSELIVIAIIALLIIGPEQLPKVARTAGRWFGKVRHYVRTVQADVEREFRAEELKRIMDEQARSAGVYEMIETTKAAGSELKSAREELESLQTAGTAAQADEASGQSATTTDDAGKSAAGDALNPTEPHHAPTSAPNAPRHG